MTSAWRSSDTIWRVPYMFAWSPSIAPNPTPKKPPPTFTGPYNRTISVGYVIQLYQHLPQVDLLWKLYVKKYYHSRSDSYGWMLIGILLHICPICNEFQYLGSKYGRQKDCIFKSVLKGDSGGGHPKKGYFILFWAFYLVYTIQKQAYSMLLELEEYPRQHTNKQKVSLLDDIGQP